jgi:WD40 repeat protein
MPDNTILIYDTRTWQLIRKLQDNNNLPWFQFSPDSSLMVTVVSDADKGKGNITIWDTNGFTAVDTDSGSPIFAVAISKDNDTIAVGYDDGIKVFRKSANPYAAAQD